MLEDINPLTCYSTSLVPTNYNTPTCYPVDSDAGTYAPRQVEDLFLDALSDEEEL